MRYELSLVRDGAEVDKGARSEPSRLALRQTTDKLIHDALLIDDLPALVTLSAETMCAVAEILVRFEIEPDVRDLVDATQALIEDGRAVMDRGLLLRSWETVRCGSVMLELAVRGLCATLSVPYDQVLVEVHRARLAGENPLVRPILTKAGLIKDPDAPPVLPCDHTVGVTVADDGDWLLASGVAERVERLRRELTTRWAHTAWAAQRADWTDAQLLAADCQLFTFCPDCGARLK